jgi:hypothetical protein
VLDALQQRVEPEPVRPRETSSGLREATAVALASDWHVEEIVHAHQTGGRNQYDLDIADVRVRRFFEGVQWLIECNRARFAIRDCVLWLGGDLLSGYIHEELQEGNQLSPVETLLWLQARIVSGIQYLLDDGELDRLHVVCSYGNHGRTTDRPRVGTGAANSYEWLLYQQLAAVVTDPRVTWQIAPGAHEWMQVYDFTMHFHHGDDVKFAGGVGGLAVPLLKRVAKWDEIRPARYHVIGHYHQRRDFERALTNGSLIGLNAYAIKVGAGYEPPEQSFFLLDSKRGKCMVSPVWVAE